MVFAGKKARFLLFYREKARGLGSIEILGQERRRTRRNC
ncbi:hypothetical protein KKC1_22880 [Calderihabitans maritimus]|uniref:Uncharacterized protein n=1 Tax=Calderihabitans maritimus TaxID=1246530 RepID=A0A1Z5HUX5_9FIRM|nr:hypothetical protein KKC1_22880 [Calderihabitans maritimus]